LINTRSENLENYVSVLAIAEHDFTFREGRRRRMMENRTLRQIFGSERGGEKTT
jgi:hypothetical protein